MTLPWFANRTRGAYSYRHQPNRVEIRKTGEGDSSPKNLEGYDPMTTETKEALDYIKNQLDNSRAVFFPLTVGTNDGEATAVFFDGRGAMFIKNDRSVFREIVNTLSNDPRYIVKVELDGNCENYTLKKA